MSKITTRAAAIAAGYTRELFASASIVDLELLAKPDADLDGAFVAFDTDAGELIRVNGWLFIIEAAGAAIAA